MDAGLGHGEGTPMKNRDTELALRSFPVGSPGRRVVQEHLLGEQRAAAHTADVQRRVAADDTPDPTDEPGG